METIIYQGQSIQAQKVNEMSGHLTVGIFPGNWHLDHVGDEALLRDAAGQYYLQRKLAILDEDGTTQRHASGRTHVHRLSLKAAAMWAVMRCNACTNDLRHDLAAALSVNHLSTTHHFADGSMAVTLHLKPEPARLVLGACEIDECSPLTQVYDGLCNEVRAALEHGRDTDEEIVAIFAGNAPSEEEADARTVVNLLETDGKLYASVPLEPDLAAMLEELAQDEGTDIGAALLNCLRRFHQQQPVAVVNTAGPDDITVPLTLPADLYRQILAMGAYDRRSDLSETIVRSMEGDVEAWLEAPDKKPTPKNFLKRFLKEHPLPALLRPPATEKQHAANLCAALAFVRAKIDEIEPDGDSQEEQDATPFRYVHIDLYAAIKRFGKVFGLKVSELMHLPPDQTERLVKSTATVELDEIALARVRRYSERWGSKVADIVNGALHFSLEDEEEQLPGCITLVDFIDAIGARRLGLDNWLTQAPAVPAPRGRHRKPKPADVALLAAAEPKDDAPPAGERPPADDATTQDGKEVR